MRINGVAICGWVLAIGVVAGCNGGPASTAELIAQLQQLDAEQALALANRWRTTQPGVTSTLTADAVEFRFAGGEEVAVPLPPDRMVVAVAPYLTKTHPCEIHSLSGCTGEMAGVGMRVFARDADGTVLIDESMTAMDNGFIELWLPRDREIDLTVVAAGRTAAGRIATFDAANTCVPEFRLE